MYQPSRMVPIFLVVAFLAISIANTVMGIMFMINISAEEFILYGTYQCTLTYGEDVTHLASITWVLSTVWEVLAVCLAVWIAVKHFRELRQHSTGGIVGDCFTVLMKTHVSYFMSFLAVSCFQMGYFSPTFSANPYTPESNIYFGFDQIFQFAQMFVLAPRLILGVREYHAERVANPDTASAMASIVFQEHVHVTTNSGV
ncbi:hypothetical protein CY34DRAFT_801667 [Suillus luteus UH-Slu-Lm8-n1]|uniref:Uncharacterized protein n=1 Tax=Suillus luteus UH-Slu-Lm8-n1 TaxID=930992 RepID=A0A0D0B618_9AGAM|nr:hypothetical protein CY34DRAFT_801667 [Suillus luteus UH-Slu-Lm8-n1]